MISIVHKPYLVLLSCSRIMDCFQIQIAHYNIIWNLDGMKYVFEEAARICLLLSFTIDIQFGREPIMNGVKRCRSNAERMSKCRTYE